MHVSLPLLAISTALNLSQASAVTTRAAVVPVNSLADVPNTTIRFYDVTGKDIASLNRSIAKQRRNASGAKLTPASMAWTVNATVKQHTENEQCKVTAAQATLAATADLPRLVDEQALEGRMLGQWRNYVAELEASQMVVLIFVYSHLDQVEKAMLASDCQNAKAAGAAAVEQVRNRTAAIQLEREERFSLSQWLLTNAALSDTASDKVVCDDLVGTGSTRKTLHVCMRSQEWEILHGSGQ